MFFKTVSLAPDEKGLIITYIMVLLSAFIATSSFAVAFCTKENLSAIGQIETAAGINYGTFTLTNVSASPCKVIGNNQLTIQYPYAVTNIKVEQTKEPSQKVFILTPKQSISAFVRSPNGSQCSSALDYPDVMFSYEIAPKSTITFMNGATKNPFKITTCQSPKEMTLIKISFKNKKTR